MKRRRAMALLLAAAMSVTALAGCSANTSNEETKAGTETKAETGETKAGEESAAADGEESQSASGDVAEIKWYAPMSEIQADQESVQNAVNEYLKDKLNVQVKFISTDFGSFDQKMQMVISSQEEFDLCFTSNWCNNFYNNVNKNAFLDIGEIVEKEAPKLKEIMPESGFAAATVGGKLYAIPNYQIWAMTNGGYIVKDYVDKSGVDISSVKSLKDLDPIFESIKKDNPDVFPMINSKQSIYGFTAAALGLDELSGMNVPGAVKYDDKELKVVNQFALPEVMEHFKLMREWNQKGYFRPDAATITDYKAEQKAGKYAAIMAGTLKPGETPVQKADFGNKDVEQFRISDSILKTSGINATMIAVSRTSKHPVEAVKLLELVNTDPVLYNLLCFGIEGTHYTKTEDGHVKPIENSGYNPNVDWTFGNQFNGYLREGQEDGVWEETKALNEAAIPSEALGFVFDPEKVQTEIASTSAIVTEYLLMLDTGAVDPEEKMPEFLDKLEKAGSQKIIDEMQTQIDVWKAAK